MTESVDQHLTDRGEIEIEYRWTEPWAVGGLLLGILASVTILTPMLWLVPLAGILVNVVALARIARDTGRSGRPAALAGLGLSVLFAVTPIANWGANYYLLSRQARPIADQFFEFLRQDSPEKAMALELGPDFRPPFDDALWLYYMHDDEAQAALKKFVKEPFVRTMLALGERAQVQFYSTRSVVSEGSLAGVQLFYTITFTDDDGHKKTFFASVILERNKTRNPDLNPWRVKTCLGGINPRPT